MFQATRVPNPFCYRDNDFTQENGDISTRTNGESTAPGVIFRNFTSFSVKILIQRAPNPPRARRPALAANPEALVEC
jgi:hypothetical protein